MRSLKERPLQSIVAAGGGAVTVYLIAASGYTADDPLLRALGWYAFSLAPFVLFLCVSRRPIVAAAALVVVIGWGYEMWRGDPDGFGPLAVPMMAAASYPIVLVSWIFNAWRDAIEPAGERG